MKKFPDISKYLVGKWLNEINFTKRLKRSWGTTTVQGEEVFVNRRYFYPTSYQNDSFIKFAKLIGSYDSLKNPQTKGIVAAWLYFNPNKFDGSDVLDDTIATYLHDTFFDSTAGLLKNGESLRVSINITNSFSGINTISGGFRPVTLSTVNYTNTIANQTALRQEIIDTYSSVWDSYKITAGSEFKKVKNNLVVGDIAVGDPWVNTFARYILFSSDISYTIINVTKGLITYKIPQYITTEGGEEYVGDKTILGHTYVVTIDIPPFFISTNTDIVPLILADINNKTSTKNPFITRNTILSRYEEPLDTEYDPESGSYYTVNRNPYNLDGLENTYWVKDGTGWSTKYYLKTSLLDDTSIPLKDRINIILGCLDTGFQQKESKWYEDLFVAIVFVVVFVVTYNAAIAAEVSVYAAAATAVVMASFVLSMVSLVAYQTGNYGLANASSEMNKAIEPLVVVAQVVLLFTSISSLAKEGAKSLASAELGSAVSATAAAEGSIELVAAELQAEAATILETRFTEALIEGITQKVTEMLSVKFTNVSLNHTIKMVNMVFDMYSKNNLAKLAENVRTLQSEYDAQQEQLAESNSQNDLIQALSTLIYSPGDMDNSVYAQQFDLPYEHTGTPYHIGNICKTSVKALRLSS